jgi:hypothetical protein
LFYRADKNFIWKSPTLYPIVVSIFFSGENPDFNRIVQTASVGTGILTSLFAILNWDWPPTTWA